MSNSEKKFAKTCRKLEKKIFNSEKNFAKSFRKINNKIGKF